MDPTAPPPAGPPSSPVPGSAPRASQQWAPPGGAQTGGAGPGSASTDGAAPPPFQPFPPGGFPPGPPAPPVGAHKAARRPLRDRLPELIATFGTLLVLGAVLGFVTSSWDLLSELHRGVVLAVASAALTAAAVFTERARRRALTRVTSLVFLAASVTAAAAVTLALLSVLPDAGRIAIGLGGLAGAGHAGWVLSRDRSSPTRLLALAAAMLFTSGPPGTAIGDRFTTTSLADVAGPLRGLFDSSFRAEAYTIPGVGWVVAGAVLLYLTDTVTGRARQFGTVTASWILFASAAMLNVAADAVGSLAALLIVAGYLIYGLLTERQAITVIGAVGALLAGTRVLWALFSGGVAVTIAALAVGSGMLLWSARAARRRGDAPHDGPDPADEHPPTAGADRDV